MWQVQVDDSDVHRAAHSATAYFRLLPDVALRAVQRAAETERQGHPYHNRTGLLEQSTMARPMPPESPGDFDIELLMGMEYASFVRHLGYSIIDRVRAQAEREIGIAIARASRYLGAI